MTVSEYIDLLARRSNSGQHELIVDCLEFHGITGTKELTLEQIAEYYQKLRLSEE